MSYFLLKLAFDTAVHFGTSDTAAGADTSSLTLRADTIFSALCHTALATGGPARLSVLCSMVQQGELQLTDAMPWRGETLYLPKPLTSSVFNASLSTTERKTLKKLAWIPVSKFDAYMASLQQGMYPLDERDTAPFGDAYEQAKASVAEGPNAQPYFVGLYSFRPDCGLYLVCRCEDTQWDLLVSLFRACGLSGIGGRVSTGYGKFHLDGVPVCLNTSPDKQHRWMLRALDSDVGPYLLLTSSLPTDSELEDALDDATFQLVRRAGFASTEFIDTPRKKQTQYYLAAGAVVQHTYHGALYDVGIGLPHPAYRYSIPLFMGVKL